MSETSKMDKLILNGQNIDLSPDYQNIRNKPKINGVTVDGNKTLDDFGVATKQEVENVSEKVDKLPTGMYYGSFDDEESLPDAENRPYKGYAYVYTGTTGIYYVYTTDGEGAAFINSGNKFFSSNLETNLANKSTDKAPNTKIVAEGIEESDLRRERTTALTAAQKYQVNANINDRVAHIDSTTREVKALGYKVLNPALTFTEQVAIANTVYEIRDEFDLSTHPIQYDTNDTGVIVSTVNYYCGDGIHLNAGEGIVVVGAAYIIDSAKTTIIKYENVILQSYFTNIETTIYLATTEANQTISYYTLINLPENITLKFNGGKLTNARLKGSNTTIEASNADNIFDKNAILSGTWTNTISSICWYGSSLDKDSTENIQRCFDDIFTQNYVDVGTWILSDTLLIRTNVNKELILVGDDIRVDIPQREELVNKSILRVTSNIPILKVEYPSLDNWYSYSFSIKGGYLQTTYADYTNAILIISGKNTSRVRHVFLETGICGVRDQYFNTNNTSIGLLLDAYDQKSGYITGITNNCCISNVQLGTKLISYKDTEIVNHEGWITDYFDNAFYNRCKQAIILDKGGSGSVLTPRIQSVKGVKGLDYTPCVYIDTNYVTVDFLAWDLTNPINVTDNTTPHSNLLACEFSDASKACTMQGLSEGQLCHYKYSVDNLSDGIISTYKFLRGGKGVSELNTVIRPYDNCDVSLLLNDCTLSASSSTDAGMAFNPYRYTSAIRVTPSSINATVKITVTFKRTSTIREFCIDHAITFNEVKISLYRETDVTPYREVFKQLTPAASIASLIRDIIKTSDYSSSQANFKKIEFLFSGLDSIESPLTINHIFVSGNTSDCYIPNPSPFVSPEFIDCQIPDTDRNITTYLSPRGKISYIVGTRTQQLGIGSSLLLDRLNSTYNSSTRTYKILAEDVNGSMGSLLFLCANNNSQSNFSSLISLFAIKIDSRVSAPYKGSKVNLFGDNKCTIEIKSKNLGTGELDGAVVLILVRITLPSNSCSLSLINYTHYQSVELDKDDLWSTETGLTTVNVRDFSTVGSVRPDMSILSSTHYENLIGYQFFDTTLGKPIYWNGSAWVDGNGETVGLQVNDTSVLISAAQDSSKTINVYSASAITAVSQVIDETSVQYTTGSTADTVESTSYYAGNAISLNEGDIIRIDGTAVILNSSKDAVVAFTSGKSYIASGTETVYLATTTADTTIVYVKGNWLETSVGTASGSTYPVTLKALSANSTAPRGAKVIITNTGGEVVIINVVQSY